MNLQTVIENLKKSTNSNTELVSLISNKQQLVNEYKLLLNSIDNDTKLSITYSNDYDKLKLYNNNCLINGTKLLKLNNLIDNITFKINDYKNNLNFNKDWVGGRHPGDIIDTPDGCRIRFDEQSRSFKFQNYKNSATTIICKDKEECYKKAKEYLYEYYNNQNKVENQYRYISPNCIEVKLPNEKTFITNSKFLDIIKNNNFSAKHNKKIDKFYVVYLSGYRKHEPFYKLITDYEQIKYSNGCTFDLREENLINGDNSVSQDDNFNDIVIKNKDGYPYNTWILGKHAGTVFQRKNENKWTVVVKKDDNTVITKTLPFDDKNKDEIYKKAVEIKKSISDSNNLTKNRIRIINDNIIEVELTKEQIMKTDYKFIEMVEKHYLYASKSEGENSRYYAGISYNNINKLFHNIITGFDMVDHIDRDPLNNCLSNLRKSDHKLNNNNRSMSTNSEAVSLGVTYIEKDDCFRARIKQNNKEYSKQFSVKKYGYEVAKDMSINARKEMNQWFNCLNG